MFTEKLHTIGFKMILHKPCCLIQDGILVFFYVDDIVLVYQKKDEEKAKAKIEELTRLHGLNILGGGDLQWFLDIKVI